MGNGYTDFLTDCLTSDTDEKASHNLKCRQKCDNTTCKGLSYLVFANKFAASD